MKRIVRDSDNVGNGGKRISDYLFACLVSFALMPFYVFPLGVRISYVKMILWRTLENLTWNMKARKTKRTWNMEQENRHCEHMKEC